MPITAQALWMLNFRRNRDEIAAGRFEETVERLPFFLLRLDI